ncbi:hypothetical protein LOZ53_003358 [Ophidiomyces ophidiicola]|nr:hypothetical protein LOZ55_003255 [Ophidiomyces ophidiicola]KAI1979334.1 hypothetical protein LOZ54_006111 [Ophidiomyces ophidiicola]KAI1990105.1 hypothetical protein LOZ53_003358 [Ophidiomyces ophidiicola]KAI1993628.1 hypothetical protein LOZ51_004007 [Ophidiomyces ophidiicola]
MLGLLFLLLAVLTPFYLVYKPPQVLMRYLQRRWPDVLWHVDTTEKLVALTIDDAPSPYTPEIQRVLAEHGAAATWFVIGAQVDGREAMLADLVRSNNNGSNDHGSTSIRHELANHAMHDETSKALSDTVLREQILAVERLIQRAYTSTSTANHSPPKYFRPGGGFFSARMRRLMAAQGYRLVLGDIYPHDAFVPYWRVNARHVLSLLHPGAIIICHDRRRWTAPMLRAVLPEIRRRGYRVVTVSELLLRAGRA